MLEKRQDFTGNFLDEAAGKRITLYHMEAILLLLLLLLLLRQRLR